MARDVRPKSRRRRRTEIRIFGGPAGGIISRGRYLVLFAAYALEHAAGGITRRLFLNGRTTVAAQRAPST